MGSNNAYLALDRPLARASLDAQLGSIGRRLAALRASINEEIRSYPTPVAGCDQQFNKLLDDRKRVAQEIRRLDDFRRLGRFRTADLQKIDAFLRSMMRGGNEGKAQT